MFLRYKIWQKQQFFLQLETLHSLEVTKAQRSLTRMSWFSFFRSSIAPS